MGNKIDEDREISEDDANTLFESLDFKQHFLVSAKTGKLLKEWFIHTNSSKEIDVYI